jgi:hypothetical protein
MELGSVINKQSKHTGFDVGVSGGSYADLFKLVLFIGTRFSNLYASVDTRIRQPEAAWWGS